MSRGAPVRLQMQPELSRLGQEWDTLFAAGAGAQTSREWFAATVEAALPPDAEPQFLAVTGPEGPLALFPMVATPDATWQSLTTPYTCLYQPLLRPDADPERLAAATAAFGRYCRRWPVTRLEALDPDWPDLPSLRAGLARAGLATRTFAHFGNWHVGVPGGAWEAYVQSRPGALRETIRRKIRAADRADGVRIEVARSGPALAAALAAYEAVYARSWKEPEPFPRFNGTLVRGLAGTGALRIGVMWAKERPVAAQYWTVAGRAATVLKLAHDEEFKALSPGTVLTASVIRELIERDGVTELDFGRGDDAYKRAWTGQRRVRIGVLGLAPWTAAGLRSLATHDGGRFLHAARLFWRDFRRRHAIAPSHADKS